MKLVKLNAIDSTNIFLKNLVKDTSTDNWTVITAKNQTSGKGQFQNKWHSEPGKNLTFSVLCEIEHFKATDAFYLNYVVSLAIFKVLKDHITEEISIKWPNDILSHSKKLCGILIENTVNNDLIIRSIIGVGLNVNQDTFGVDLANATSMKNIANKSFDRMVLLEELISELKQQVQRIENKKFELIKNDYEEHLYRKNVPAMYKDELGHPFMAKILGVNEMGNLVMELENESIKSFDLKEIQFI